MENPALSAVFRSGSNASPTLASASTVTPSGQSVTAPLQWQAQLPTTQQEPVSRITLLETPKPLRPILLGDAPPGYPPVKPVQIVPGPEKEASVSPVVATNLNNLLNAQNLNQLLGSLTEAKNGTEKPIEMLKPAIRRPPGQRPVLLADPPGTTIDGTKLFKSVLKPCCLFQVCHPLQLLQLLQMPHRRRAIQTLCRLCHPLRLAFRFSRLCRRLPMFSRTFLQFTLP
jgi:hypothetical protein